MFLSPTATIAMLDAGRPNVVDTSGFLVFFTGGDKTSRHNLQRLCEQLPGTVIVQVYGESEVGGLITAFKHYDSHQVSLLEQKFISVGASLPGFRLKVNT